jgi:hypothetical protein
MDPPRSTQFVVTPWRDSKELLRLRHDLYGSDTASKERAVNKVSWRWWGGYVRAWLACVLMACECRCLHGG